MLEILIDNRETKLKNYFKEDINFSFANLELGDIIIKYNGNLLLIIERKRIDDLASSIKDGRYKQQKIRLINNYKKTQILYLIEGDFNKKIKDKLNGITYYTLQSSLLNCLLRDNLMIYKTENIDETIKFIDVIKNKLLKQGITFLNNSNNSIEQLQNSLIKKNKKENITKETCFLGQLCQIPNISIKKAKPIVKEYKNMSNFIISLHKLDYIEKIEHLSNIIISTSKKLNKSGKNIIRKLGKKAAVLIIEHLFQ